MDNGYDPNDDARCRRQYFYCVPLGKEAAIVCFLELPWQLAEPCCRWV